MAEEIIRFGAGGVPYKPTTPLTPEVEEAPTPEVTVSVTEKEHLGEIPQKAKKRTAKEDVVTDDLGTA